MEIRSITFFTEPGYEKLSSLTTFLSEVRLAFHVPVQTTRLALPPFPDWWDSGKLPTGNPAEFAAHWQSTGVDYISLGPVQLQHSTVWLDRVPEILAATGVLFAGAEIADTAGQIDIGRCLAVAALIQQASTLYENGFGNLYLAALANCPPGAPFFPVAYHHGGRPDTGPHFAIAVEAADLARKAIQSAGSLAEARQNLITAIEQEAGRIAAAAAELSATYHIPFSGIDFSLAPFPEKAKSLAGAMEALGLAHVGGPGSLFTAAFITEAIDRADFPRCGFSGLMLPVLEDSVLAVRAAEGLVTISDLLSYSAVCGVGLDTVPLPGDISRETLAGILLDVAALAVRLNKPLTARLMPLPGLAAGDPIHFDFPYFADSRVMASPGQGIGGLLQRLEKLEIEPRRFDAPAA
jgi:uncharacterized protein (UPF0210 family)